MDNTRDNHLRLHQLIRDSVGNEHTKVSGFPDITTLFDFSALGRQFTCIEKAAWNWDDPDGTRVRRVIFSYYPRFVYEHEHGIEGIGPDWIVRRHWNIGPGKLEYRGRSWPLIFCLVAIPSLLLYFLRHPVLRLLPSALRNRPIWNRRRL